MKYKHILLMESAAFDAAEAVIQRGQHTFLDVGAALMAIRDGRWYRLAGFDTFENYCRVRWGIDRRRGYELIAATEVVANVRSTGQTPGLTQAVVLAPLPPGEQRRVVQDIGNLTAYSTRQLRQEVLQRQAAAAEQRALARRGALAPILAPDPFDDEVQVGLAEDLPWPDGSIDLVVTSPPYCLSIDYANGGDVDSYDVYREQVNAWSRELLRVSNPEHGRLCLNVPVDTDLGGWRSVAHHWQTALENAGWQYRTQIIWNKGQAGSGTDRGSLDSAATPNVTAPVELVLVYYRDTWSRAAEMKDRQSDLSHAEWLEWCGPRGVWDFPGEHDTGHPAVFPDQLAWRCIKLFSLVGDVVGDPFCGRGTTPRVAARLGRRIRAVDRSPVYVARAQAEVAAARAAQLYPAEQAA